MKVIHSMVIREKPPQRPRKQSRCKTALLPNTIPNKHVEQDQTDAELQEKKFVF